MLPSPGKPCLSFLVGLVAEVSVDPLDHRHRGSRHPGDEQHVHARHEHLADPEMAERVDRDRGADACPLAGGGKAVVKQDARVGLPFAVREDVGIG